MAVCRAGLGRYAPACCGSSHEHGARRRSGLPQRCPEAADRRRTARQLRLEKGLGVERSVRRRRDEIDLVEAEIEFLGKKHGLRRVNSLPHLHGRHDQYDAAGRLNANAASNLLRRWGVPVRAVTNQDARRDDLRTCQRECDDESADLEDAPIDVLAEAAHVAAALIASRIRG
jgi:hypothetical protein